MGWKKIGRGLAKIAPVAARAATAGLLGGGVADAITEAVGLARGSSEDDVEEALAKASPAEYAQMRTRLAEIEAEADKQERELRYRTRELETREAKIAADDRASARQREVSVGDSTPRVMAWTVIAGVLGISAALVWIEVPQANQPVLNTVVGALAALLITIGNYYYGTSQSSRRKDEAIHRAIDAAARSG